MTRRYESRQSTDIVIGHAIVPHHALLPGWVLPGGRIVRSKKAAEKAAREMDRLIAKSQTIARAA